MTNFLDSAANLRIGDIDAAIEHHTRQVDMLRLLRQLVEIREEGLTVGAVQVAAPVAVVEPPRPVAAPIEAPDQKAYAAIPDVKAVSPDTIRQRPKGRSAWFEPVPTTHAARIRDLLAARGKMLVSDIARELDIPIGSLGGTLGKWADKGLFKKVDHGVYQLASQAEAPRESNGHTEAEPDPIAVWLAHRNCLRKCSSSEIKCPSECESPGRVPRPHWSTGSTRMAQTVRISVYQIMWILQRKTTLDRYWSRVVLSL